jgi:hypothetical protein
MSVDPLCCDAAQTAATTVPFAASETFAFVLSATVSVFDAEKCPAVCAAGETTIEAHAITNARTVGVAVL